MPTRKTTRKGDVRSRSAKKAKPKAKSTKTKTKARAKAKASAKTKAKAKKTKKKRAPVRVAMGDAVRLPAEAGNQILRYNSRAARGARGAEAIEGLVCSIRDIATGKLVAKTRGDLDGYVLEVLHIHTFSFEFSAERNTGGRRGSDQVSDNPSWVRVRKLLKEAADRKERFSTASGGLTREPFSSLLDGWRVVKVRAELAELVE